MPIINAFVASELRPRLADSYKDALAKEWIRITSGLTGYTEAEIAVFWIDLSGHRNADPLELGVELPVGRGSRWPNEEPLLTITHVGDPLTRALREALRTSTYLPAGITTGVWLKPVAHGKYERTRVGAEPHEGNL